MYDFSKVKSLGIAQAARSQVKKTSGAIGALAIPMLICIYRLCWG